MMCILICHARHIHKHDILITEPCCLLYRHIRCHVNSFLNNFFRELAPYFSPKRQQLPLSESICFPSDSDTSSFLLGPTPPCRETKKPLQLPAEARRLAGGVSNDGVVWFLPRISQLLLEQSLFVLLKLLKYEVQLWHHDRSMMASWK